MKKFIRSNPLIYSIALILVTIILVGVLSNLTEGFTEFDPGVIFTPDRNQSNLLYGKYEDFDEHVDSAGVTFTNKNDIIYIDGKISDADSAIDAELVLTSVELDAGTYTYTCFKNPTASTYYSYIRYKTSDGVTHVVFGDWKSSSLAIDGATVEGCSTVELDAKTTVEVVIVACKGNTFENVKAEPCLVKGDKAGNFYAD